MGDTDSPLPLAAAVGSIDFHIDRTDTSTSAMFLKINSIRALLSLLTSSANVRRHLCKRLGSSVWCMNTMVVPGGISIRAFWSIDPQL